MKAAAELRSNVDKMEQCSREFAETMQTCIDYLVEYRTRWLQQLQTDKEELALAIETALQEATDCLDQGVEPESALAQAMWTRPTEELQVFTYTVNTPDLPMLCVTWAHHENRLKSLSQPAVRPITQQVYATLAQPEEVKPPPPTPVLANRAVQSQTQLACVTESHISFFDFQRGAWKQPFPLNSDIQADNTCSWVILEDGSVFICGGGYTVGVWSTVYVVREGCVEQTRSMHWGRCWHGVLAYRDGVYVFGGSNNKSGLNSCEKYGLQQHTWTLLPRMHKARINFNPCLFNGNIYLCGYPHSLLEAFSPQTDLMLPFQLSMPANSPCCMYVEDDLLVVHLSGNILKYRAGQAELLVQTSTNSTQEEVNWQNSQPAVHATLRLYYIVKYSCCYSVNMDTGVVGPAINQVSPTDSCEIA